MARGGAAENHLTPLSEVFIFNRRFDGVPSDELQQQTTVRAPVSLLWRRPVIAVVVVVVLCRSLT